MGADDPAGLELLFEHIGPDLTELIWACTAVLTSTQVASKQLVWNPNASDSELIACLKDLIDAMATVTGSTLAWDENTSLRASSPSSFRKARPTLPALHLVCNCDEAMTDARVLQVVFYTLLYSPAPCTPQPAAPHARLKIDIWPLSSIQTEMAMRLGRLVTTDKPNLVRASSGFVLAPRGGTSGRRLSGVKAYRNGKGEAGRAEAIAVLLSERVLHEPAALVEIYQCARHGKVIVPICLIGRGYDYKKAGDHLGDLEAGLSARKIAELKQRLEALSGVDDPNGTAVTVASLQAVLLATLPRIIAVNWEPEGGKNQLDATVTNVLARLAQASITKPQATQVKMGTLRAAVWLVKKTEAAQAARAGSTRSPKGAEVDVASTTTESV